MCLFIFTHYCIRLEPSFRTKFGCCHTEKEKETDKEYVVASHLLLLLSFALHTRQHNKMRDFGIQLKDMRELIRMCVEHNKWLCSRTTLFHFVSMDCVR